MAVPLLGILVIVGLYFTPVSAMGTANRGIAAMAVAAVAGIAAAATGWKASRASRSCDPSAGWWLASMVILLIPMLLLVWPLG